MSAIVVDFPGLKLVSEANQRGMWTKSSSRKKDHRKMGFLLLRSAGVRALVEPVTVTITRTAPRPLDDDNLASSAKALRDGIADALGVDDRDGRVAWRYVNRRGEVREYAVRVRVAPRETCSACGQVTP